MKKSNLAAGLSFVLGVAGVQLYGHQLKKEIRGGTPTDVLVVTADLKVGDKLSEENLSAVSVPSNYLDERRILGKERADLIGVAVSGALRAGDGLVWSDLADGAAHRHLASVVMPGRRAYGLSAKANPLGRLLRVGDHVDVLLERSGSSETLLERVLVLAVGSELSDRGEAESARGRGRGVTLSVSADQAELLLSAEERGRLRLTVRNPEDLRVQEKAEKKVAKAPRRPVAFAPETKEIEHVR